MKEAHRIVKTLVVTEKGTGLTEKQNKYLFNVYPDANKVEIKQAVESLFGVGVTKVNTMCRKGKLKRERSQRYGRTSGCKRALVSLRDGDKIDLT
jgi:large subunit ribosomal protein L23